MGSLIGWICAAVAVLIFVMCVVGFVSPRALKDPKTGAVPKRWHMFLGAWLGPVLPGAVALMLLWFNADEAVHAGAPALRIEPEMLVKVARHPNFGCVSEALYRNAVAHTVAGEKSKFSAMFDRGDCIVLPKSESASFKVLAVHGTVLEFTNSTNTKASQGLWGGTDTFSPL